MSEENSQDTQAPIGLRPPVDPDQRHNPADHAAYRNLMRSLKALEGLVNHYYLRDHNATATSQPAQTVAANAMREIIHNANRSIIGQLDPTLVDKCPPGFYSCYGDCIRIGQPCD